MATRSRRPRGLSANHVNEGERLMTILNDKSTLSSVRLLGKESWVKMEERPNCFYCARKFRPFALKRHCRSCGEIVCSNCYRRRKVRVTSMLHVTVRLCFDCIDKAMLVAESDRINASVPVMERLESTEHGGEREYFGQRNARPDVKNPHFFDSTQTTSTSMDSHLSTFSSRDGGCSQAESNESATTRFPEHGNHERLAHSPDSMIEPHRDDTTCLARQKEWYEAQRHKCLLQWHVLDTEPERAYDAVCEFVRHVFDCNVAAVAFMDRTRQWYKARHGIAQAELPREIAFCSHVGQTSVPTMVMDATKDARFCHNPLVRGSAHIRFYASTAICDPTTGIVLGSIFVMDPQPKDHLPVRAIEVLSYASLVVEKLLQGEPTTLVARSVAPTRPASSSRIPRRDSMPSFSELGTASLQSVPEELEDGDVRATLPRSNTSHLSSSLDNSTRRHARPTAPDSRPRCQLLDPSVRLLSSASTKASASTNSKLCIADLAGVEPKRTAPAPRVPRQVERLDLSCVELLSRIASTQALLARQHDTIMGTLTRHSSRISKIEGTVDRIERTLAAQQQEPHLGTRHPADS